MQWTADYAASVATWAAGWLPLAVFHHACSLSERLLMKILFVQPRGSLIVSVMISLVGHDQRGVGSGKREHSLSQAKVKTNKSTTKRGHHSRALSLAGAATSIIFVLTKVLSRQTCICCDKTHVCRNKTCMLSRQKHACWDKITHLSVWWNSHWSVIKTENSSVKGKISETVSVYHKSKISKRQRKTVLWSENAVVGCVSW